ncbi:hypothetical protein Misp01_59690 [Microtetraspora sp. NBRC 13810]|uniref:hypothetical protein n=1 Tax=Microtetraspora sp. NBRC 13810 TaxID=3030990 RepID=UPI0024A5F012|nr:hypothetical protein [Microtetraspora sp. NBRC 13810]GLW10841.1 hypothetical protein Misp01_59690 [Microtetraspora sp. NBRC 13810]
MRRVTFFDVVIMAGGLLMVFLAAQNAGPALAAARGDGTPGTFTATRVECVRHPGHEQCTWFGDYRSADGRVRRDGISFYGADRETFRPGQTARAFDVGRRGHVYGPGGSNEWIVVALLFAGGAWLALRPLLRRPRQAAPAP